MSRNKFQHRGISFVVRRLIFHDPNAFFQQLNHQKCRNNTKFLPQFHLSTISRKVTERLREQILSL